MESLTPRPELENTRKSHSGDRTGWLGPARTDPAAELFCQTAITPGCPV